MYAPSPAALEEREPVSGIHQVPSVVVSVRRDFVENWGKLAATFGMDRDLGRVHAELFLADEPVSIAAVARSLDLGAVDAARHVALLVEWGVAGAARAPGGEGYTTSREPWGFFLEILRQRHVREFLPVLALFRQTQALSAELGRGSSTRTRVEQFGRFVEDLSGLVELFVRVGARPMGLVLKTVARVAPRA
ncbi:MAG: hypothetical protein FJ104_00810 [Deltaproteobacteria bacterium]|nr:hypothetical protein [Deltaproteobacteria bacterium]